MSGVASVTPVEIGLTRWRSPVTDRTRGILAIGILPEQPGFTTPEIRQKAAPLTDEEFVLIDRKARKEFGPQNGRQFCDADIGVETEVNGKQVRIVGHFPLGTGLTADGCMLVNSIGFRRLVPPLPPGEVSFGLVRLQPDADLPAAAADMRRCAGRILPDGEPGDVEVLTRPEAIRYELNRWIRHLAGHDLSARRGRLAAGGDGDRLPGALQRRGRPHAAVRHAEGDGLHERFLSRVVLGQALGLALLGFVPGLVLSLGLYALTSYLANLPIEMNGLRVLFVLVLTVAMCALSGLGALRKVWLADPAALF